MNEKPVALSAERLEAGQPVRLWYAVAGAPAAWILQSSLGWLITGRACADGQASAATRGLLLILGLTALAAGLYGALVGIAAWRRAHTGEDVLRTEGRTVVEYVVAAGVFVSAVFTLAIIWTTLPALMVDVCQGIR